jgi:hypothetical protein
MKITIRTDKNYGLLTYYPACKAAASYSPASPALKTLTAHALRDIAALGYRHRSIQPTAPNDCLTGDRTMTTVDEI